MPQYCTVFHRIDSIKIDGEDPDRNPDRVPVTGTIIFTPILAQGDSVVVTEDGVKTTLNIEPVTAQIQLGQLMHRGELGVKLFAGGENSNPERIRWRATFHNLISGTTKITLKDVVFEAIPGGELALSLTQPVPQKPYPGFSQNLEEALQAITEAGENTAIELEAIVAEAESVARTTAQQELDVALPTKADKVHTHTTAQVTGLDTALTGKADASTLDARIPAGLALRVDTSVGTRVFAGDTMIYGDTGRRLLVSWDTNGNIVGTMPVGLAPISGTNGYIAIRREANLVTMYIRGARATATSFAVQGLVSGFTAVGSTWELGYARAGTNSVAKQVLVRLGIGHVTFSGLEAGDQFGDSQYHVTVRWAPDDYWPTSLPGLPA